MILMAGSPPFLWAQSEPSTARDIKGYIVDASTKEALPYASVALKGTYRGTTTNARGYFILVNAPAAICTLVVQHIGYTTQQAVVDNRQPSPQGLHIAMTSRVLEMEAVTVRAEEYKIWQNADEVSQLTLSVPDMSTLPNLGEIDIFRTLQLLPGISGINDGSSGLYIRGGTPDQNLVILDGMTIYHVDHFFGFFSAFNADAVKDIQTFKGGFPAKYGGRLSSVVELTGKSGDFNHMRLSAGVNLLSGNFVVEVPIAGKSSWLISARRSYTDVIQSGLYNDIFNSLTGGESISTTSTPTGGPAGGRFISRGFQQQSSAPSFYFYDINSKLTFAPNNRDVLSLSIYNGQDHLDQSQEVGGLRLGPFGPSTEETDEDSTGTRRDEDLTDWGNLGVSMQWVRQWYDRLNSNLFIAQSKYFSDHSRDLGFTFGSSSTPSDSSTLFQRGRTFASGEENTITDATVRFDNEWHATSGHRIGFGISASRIRTDYTATRNDTIQILDEKNTATDLSFYLQDIWKIGRYLQLTVGSRATRYYETNRFYFDPRASMHVFITDRMTLKGAAGKYHQFIHRVINDDVLEGSRDFWLVADENLKPGEAEHYIVGLEYETGQYIFGVEAYDKRMENLIEFSRRFQEGADYDNLFFFGDGIARGIEFLVQKKAGRLNGWLSYTLGKVEHTFPGIENGRPFPASHDRTHELKLVHTFSKGGWNFSSTWVYATGQPYTEPENQYFITLLDGSQQTYINVGPKNANRLPVYHRLDLSGSRRFTITDKVKGEVGLSIFNAYAHANVSYRKYDLDVSPIVVTDVTSLGFTPTVFVKFGF
jgi:hypothetical protein